MTAPRASDAGDLDVGAPEPTPRLLLLVPCLLVLIAATLTPDSELYANQGDVRLYLEKATSLAGGLIPYRDFPFEYPPAALVPMAAPYLAWFLEPVAAVTYKWLFAGWSAILMLALGFVLTRIVRLGGGDGVDRPGARRVPPARMRTAAIQLSLVTAGAALALAFRFDLFPALLAMVAVWAAIGGRPSVAGIAVALGVLAKLYPLAVVPALAVPWLVPLDARRLVRFGLAAGITVVVGLAPFVALAGDEALAFLRYQAARGLQVESIGGGLAVLGGLLSGSPVPMSFGFSAVQVEGPFAAAWLGALPGVTLAGFGLLGWLGWRRIRAEGGTAGTVSAGTVVTLAFASVLVLLATSKVFSIQYIVWIVPFAALLRGRQFWLAAALIALTMPIHPLLYGELVKQQALPILVLNLRNALFLALLAWVLRDVAAGRSGRSVARPAGLEPTTFRSAT